jgi:hypothetical protein
MTRMGQSMFTNHEPMQRPGILIDAGFFVIIPIYKQKIPLYSNS